MMNEKGICELLSSLLPEGRLNHCFESDSEIICINGTQCLFSTDEFSEEDLFRENNPYVLGWNIAVGAISDILACGGSPLFYAHALTVDVRWDCDYLTRFGTGVRDVLNQAGARFIGGDCGRSPLWRCTASVIGSCDSSPITRRGAAPGDLIYLTGHVGAGNLEAALRLRPDEYPSITNQFCLRKRESIIMRQFASCCIDTSDGVCAALNTLADINECGYEIADLPYSPQGVDFCRAASMPKTLLFLGECGEYELLLTVKPDREAAFLAEAQSSGSLFHQLGRIAPGKRILHEEGRTIDLGSLRIEARDFKSPMQYLETLARWLRDQQCLSQRRS